MNMYILIYINCTEGVWGMHVRWNYPPCIQVYSRIFGDKMNM